MTTEIVYQKENNLTVTVNQNHVLLNEPAFKRPDAYLHNVVLAEILKSYTHLTWNKPSDTDLMLMVNEVKSAIQNKYKSIRAEEIADIFADGIRKVYGDYMGLSTVSFEMFIMGYLESRKRKDLALSMPKEEKDRTPSEQEIYDLSVQNCKTAFLDIKSKGTVGRFGVIVYDFLTKIGILQLDKETRWQYYEDAKSDLQEYLKSKMFNCNDKHEVNRLKSDLNSIIEGVKTENNEQKLITISKRLAVDDYFRGLEMEGLTIEEVLK